MDQLEATPLNFALEGRRYAVTPKPPPMGFEKFFGDMDMDTAMHGFFGLLNLVHLLETEEMTIPASVEEEDHDLFRKVVSRIMSAYLSTLIGFVDGPPEELLDLTPDDENRDEVRRIAEQYATMAAKAVVKIQELHGATRH